MNKPLVVILMGSKSDLAFSQRIADAVRSFDIDVVLRVGSAHKTPRHLLDMVQHYEADPHPKVYITVAGRSNALSGFIDGAVSAPVIACPPPSEHYASTDIYSSLRMPRGVAPAVVLEPVNAALLAAKILALGDDDLRTQVVDYQKRVARETLSADDELESGKP